MSFLSLLNSLHHILVETEGERNRQHGQCGIGDDRNHREDREREQDGQNGTQHHATLTGIAPIDQVCH